MNKKGISPLIATVLLIGFTIVLASLVFRWGGDFFRDQTRETEEEIEQVLVLSGVEVKVKDIDFPNTYNKIKLLIENKREIIIEGFIVRIHGSEGVIVGNIDGTLDAFSSNWFNVIYEGDAGEVQRVEVLSKVDFDGNIVTSESVSDSYVFDEPVEIEEMLIDEHTVAYWKFDEGSGTSASDSTGNGNDGILMDMDDTNWVDGKFGTALSFNGIDEFVDCGDDDSLDLIDEITIEAWVYPTAVAVDFPRLVSKGTGNEAYELSLYNIDRVWFDFKDAYPAAVYNLGDDYWGEWYHFAVTWREGETAKIYVDGILVKESVAPINGVLGAYPCGALYIASRVGHGYVAAYFFEGIIDEVRISNVVRTF
ncbi:MAG: LamG domain-containing protein [Nanoarchaeota archaeon]|nr:LamG domain-containing protein [Nanoarchaeota archaeon]MBU1445584.1 LamG domain-containing protein [Nanoarchaeota archaeon]MBU2420402.1 LamG domain-containing protein [Nanoarchaeota archaeon]MBU2475795.1 LamG domain-containing protein [Nanoarchaeota archaeon]